MESWVVVTGAGSGIGREIVLALAREQRRIVLVGRRRELLEQTAADARAVGATCCVIDLDLGAPGAVEELANKVHEQCGRVSVLINNAAVLAQGPVETFELADIERAVKVNLTAPLQLVRAFLPDLVATSGTVVLVASTAGWVPFPYTSLYVATKAGLRMWGEAFRAELEAQGARLLIAYPPFTATSMTSGISDGAGVRVSLASADVVGQRIVQAMNAGRRELWCAWTDWLLVSLEGIAPRLMQALLRNQRKRFERMMTGADAKL